MENKKYYWLKLKRDFFKRHDMQIIEAMPNGKDYVLFYLKLLVESVDHDGELRFSDTIPYNEQMLATITNTNIDIVRSAMKIFTELNMIDVLDNQTIYMSEVQGMLGAETYWAERKRIQNARKLDEEYVHIQVLSREQIKLPSGKVQFVDNKRYGGNAFDAFERARGVCELCGSDENLCIHHKNGYSNELDDLVVLCRKCHRNSEIGKNPICPSKVQHISKQEIDTDTDTDKKRETEKRARFSPPSVEEVSGYCEERRNRIDPQAFVDFYTSKGWKVGKEPMKDWKACVRTWEQRRKNDSPKQDERLPPMIGVS